MAIGSALRNARVQRGLTIEQAAQDTRISARFLEAIEGESFDALPAPVYVRGFVRSYANYLKLDPGPLLAELASAGVAPVAGPDAFVAGPRRRSPVPAGRDPFRPAPPPPPPPPLADDDTWAPEDLPDERDREPAEQRLRVIRDASVEPDVGTYRPRRVAGVLTEREAQYNESSGGMRVLAVAGGVLIIAFFVVAMALLLGGGNDDQSLVPPVNRSGDTPTSRPVTVVAVGSATALATTATASATTPSISPTPSGSATPASPTATPTGAQATDPTVKPTDTPTPSPTPDTPVPTPTPTIPPPPPTPIPSHPYYLDECGASGSCGRKPYRVVCAPDGWFIDRSDVNGEYPASQYGWTVMPASNIDAAKSVCGQ